MLTAESAATLVHHAFVTSRVDYCNVVLAGALKVITNKLQRVIDECSSPRSDRYQEVRPRFDAADA